MSLTSDDIADLKQLIEATVGQQMHTFEKNVTRRFEDLEAKIEAVDNKFEARFDEQDEKMNEILNAVGADLAKHTAMLDDHEERVSRLEQAA